MNRREAATLEGELETRRLALSFLWKRRGFALYADFSFCRYKGAELRHSAAITQTTSVSKRGDREFVLVFVQPELRYHIRATCADQRDRSAQLLLCRAASNVLMCLLLHSDTASCRQSPALPLRLSPSLHLCPLPLHRCPPSTSPPSGLTRTGACAPRTSTTRRNVPKATISCRLAAAAAAAARTSCAACATRRRRGSMRASGWCAAWLAAAGATPCAQRALLRSTARMQRML